MKIHGLLSVILAASLLTAFSSLQADPITITWADQDDATSWVIYQSEDLGSSWTQYAEVDRPATPPAQIQFSVDAPSGHLVLYRVAAKNSQAEVIRTEAGVWYNSLWKLPAAPQQVGVD